MRCDSMKALIYTSSHLILHHNIYTFKDTRSCAGKTIVSNVSLFDLSVSTSTFPIPITYKHAFSDPNWSVAMRSEYDALLRKGTWQLVPKPPGANVVSSKWAFCHNYNSDGSLSRYKARWVVLGFLKNAESTTTTMRP
jgi:hypothetical protein